MRLDDGFDEAEPEAEAAFSPATVAPKESIEDPRQLVRGDAVSGIAHPEHCSIAGSMYLDLHASARGGVLHRVVDQIRCHLLEAGAGRRYPPHPLRPRRPRPPPPVPRPRGRQERAP